MHMAVKEIDNIDLRDKIISHLNTRLHNCELSNKDIIAIIELVGSYGNCCTISDYAKREGISYNGALDRISKDVVQIVNIFGVKFVINNE
jgi:hypothetical protein